MSPTVLHAAARRRWLRRSYNEAMRRYYKESDWEEYQQDKPCVDFWQTKLLLSGAYTNREGVPSIGISPLHAYIPDAPLPLP